jgi:hypothetical protein
VEAALMLPKSIFAWRDPGNGKNATRPLAAKAVQA